MRTTPKGLTVWDLPTDQFNHTSLTANLDLIDSLLGTPAQSVQTLSALPLTGNFAGRVVMLSSADGGFQPWTLVAYNGTSWRPVNQLEIQPILPTSGNFAGRIVILSQDAGAFPAWSVVRFDGSTWGVVGGWAAVSTGSNSTNISGLSISGDIYVADSARGLVVRDRNNGQIYRLFFSNGNLQYETVA